MNIKISIFWFIYTDIFILMFRFHAASIYTCKVNACLTFQSMLFPILINTCPAASVHLNRKLYQEICSAFCANQNITVSFVLWTISRPNTGASQHWDVMGPVENGDTGDLRWYVERLFLLHFNHFFFLRVRGVPGGPTVPGKVTLLLIKSTEREN